MCNYYDVRDGLWSASLYLKKHESKHVLISENVLNGYFGVKFFRNFFYNIVFAFTLCN